MKGKRDASERFCAQAQRAFGFAAIDQRAAGAKIGGGGVRRAGCEAVGQDCAKLACAIAGWTRAALGKLETVLAQHDPAIEAPRG